MDYFKDTKWEKNGVSLLINDIINYLDNIYCPIRYLEVEKLYDYCCHKDKKDYESNDRVLNLDISYPIIVGKNKEKTIIIDGNHRLVKAKSLNIKYIKCRIFDINQSNDIIKSIFN